MKRALTKLLAYLGYVPEAQLRRAEDDLAVALAANAKVRALAVHEMGRRVETEERFDRYREAVLSDAFKTRARVDGLHVQLELPEPAFSF